MDSSICLQKGLTRIYQKVRLNKYDMVLFDIFIVIQPDPTREANAAMMAFEKNRKVLIRF